MTRVEDGLDLGRTKNMSSAMFIRATPRTNVAFSRRMTAALAGRGAWSGF